MRISVDQPTRLNLAPAAHRHFGRRNPSNDHLQDPLHIFSIGLNFLSRCRRRDWCQISIHCSPWSSFRFLTYFQTKTISNRSEILLRCPCAAISPRLEWRHGPSRRLCRFLVGLAKCRTRDTLRLAIRDNPPPPPPPKMKGNSKPTQKELE